MLNIGVCNSSISCFVLKGAMSRIARLLSHHSNWRYKFARASKKPLNEACKSWDFQLLVVSPQDLTSNCHEADEFQFEIIVPTTRSQYENDKLSKISSTSFHFDFGFRIQSKKVRLAWRPRRTWHSPFKICKLSYRWRYAAQWLVERSWNFLMIQIYHTQLCMSWGTHMDMCSFKWFR